MVTLVSICALTAGALSRFFFLETISPAKGVFPPHSSAAMRGERETRPDLSPFKINTCESVSKQRTLTTFRMNTYIKTGGGVCAKRSIHGYGTGAQFQAGLPRLLFASSDTDGF